MMNAKAQELGLDSTHFITPHGLDMPEHYTTAFELAKMADYALKIDKFKEIVSTKSTTIYINNYPKAINNTNQLLGSVSGLYGVKTGFTNGAGRCLVSACKRDDLDIITVVIGANTTKERTSDTIKLIQYANQKFEIINIKEIIESKFIGWKNINEGRIYVNKGLEDRVELYLDEFPYEKMAIEQEDRDKIEIKVNCIFNLEAPIEEKQVLGNVSVMLDGNVLEILNIYNKKEIIKKDVKDYWVIFIKKFDEILESLIS